MLGRIWGKMTKCGEIYQWRKIFEYESKQCLKNPPSLYDALNLENIDVMKRMIFATEGVKKIMTNRQAWRRAIMSVSERQWWWHGPAASSSNSCWWSDATPHYRCVRAIYRPRDSWMKSVGVGRPSTPRLPRCLTLHTGRALPLLMSHHRDKQLSLLWWRLTLRLCHGAAMTGRTSGVTLRDGRLTLGDLPFAHRTLNIEEWRRLLLLCTTIMYR